MTALDLDRLLALREQATGGEWEISNGAVFIQIGTKGAASLSLLTLEGKIPPADAALIVAAVNALPGLVAKAREAERLRELLDLAADHVPGDCDHHDEILAALSPSDGGDQ